MSPVQPAGTPSGRRAGTGPAAPAGGVVRPRAPEPPAQTDPDVEAEADPPADEVDGAEATEAPPRRKGGAPWWALGVTSALAVLAVLALVVVLFARPSDKALRDSALLAARSYVTDLTTYDARTLDADIARVKKVSSPEFIREYDANIAKVRDTIIKGQSVSTGTVVGAGLEQLAGNNATLLVAVNQTFQAPGQQSRTEANRVRVTLVRTSGNWYLRTVIRL